MAVAKKKGEEVSVEEKRVHEGDEGFLISNCVKGGGKNRNLRTSLGDLEEGQAGRSSSKKKNAPLGLRARENRQRGLG